MRPISVQRRTPYPKLTSAGKYLSRIPRMDWRSASLVRQFTLVGQDLTPDQVAATYRTRRVKEGIHGFASVHAAFGRVGRIQMGNPGL